MKTLIFLLLALCAPSTAKGESRENELNCFWAWKEDERQTQSMHIRYNFGEFVVCLHSQRDRRVKKSCGGGGWARETDKKKRKSTRRKSNLESLELFPIAAGVKCVSFIIKKVFISPESSHETWIRVRDAGSLVCSLFAALFFPALEQAFRMQINSQYFHCIP